MKTNIAMMLCLGAVFILLFAGCATPHVDWNARIGTCTFDQAVNELGPPDKQVTLTDGGRVAEWITRYYGNSTSIISPGFYGRPGGVAFVQTIGPNVYETSLRLTFNTSNILTQWSKH